jgi:hypothetical protein
VLKSSVGCVGFAHAAFGTTGILPSANRVEVIVFEGLLVLRTLHELGNGVLCKC